jgi:hypothetical protein
MANPATTADIEARWRPLSAQEQSNAAAFLDDAWALLLDRRPNLEADLLDGKVSEANAVRVVATMALRVLKNPDGFLEEAVDDYRYRRDALVSSGALHVTADELAVLTPRTTTPRRNSVRLVVHGDD